MALDYAFKISHQSARVVAATVKLLTGYEYTDLDSNGNTILSNPSVILFPFPFEGLNLDAIWSGETTVKLPAFAVTLTGIEFNDDDRMLMPFAYGFSDEGNLYKLKIPIQLTFSIILASRTFEKLLQIVDAMSSTLNKGKAIQIPVGDSQNYKTNAVYFLDKNFSVTTNQETAETQGLLLASASIRVQSWLYPEFKDPSGEPQPIQTIIFSQLVNNYEQSKWRIYENNGVIIVENI